MDSHVKEWRDSYKGKRKKNQEDLQALQFFIVDLCSWKPGTPVHWTAFGLYPQFMLYFQSIRTLSLDQQK